MLIFICLFCVSLSLFSELEVNNRINDHQEISHINQDLDDCQKDDCHDEGGHCEHHCSGLHSLVFIENTITTNPSSTRADS